MTSTYKRKPDKQATGIPGPVLIWTAIGGIAAIFMFGSLLLLRLKPTEPSHSTLSHRVEDVSSSAGAVGEQKKHLNSENTTHLEEAFVMDEVLSSGTILLNSELVQAALELAYDAAPFEIAAP